MCRNYKYWLDKNKQFITTELKKKKTVSTTT